VKYISETYGADAIPKIARNLSRFTALTIDGAIERAIGKTGKDLYGEWREHIVTRYKQRTEPIRRNRVEGETIGSVGFGNFYPAFSPDGKKLAYTSNKTADYFGLSSVYVYDLDTKKEEEIDEKVHSSVSWSPDGKKIYYSKITRDNPHWSGVSDIYAYDIDAKKDTRLTFSLRALNPSASSDGKKIVFATENDGTMNVAVVDSDGKNFHLVTAFKNGEQVFTPKWSPDGNAIVFGYSLREAQDVARVTPVDGNVEMLVTGDDDARNPVYTPDGKRILFASDRTGIFNLYSYDVQTKAIEQISNVLGGAFMPSVNQSGDVAFASYTSGGFKLNLLRAPSPQNFAANCYVPESGKSSASSDSTASNDKIDWAKLRAYDDSQLPAVEPKPYKNILTSLSIIPFLRIDKYSTTNKGIDYVKPGFYFTSSDVIEKYSIFGGAAMNHLFDRDLFFIFEYRGKVIGLSQLRLSPTVSFEIYNVTRRGEDASFDLGLDHYEGIETKYGLLEFDLNLKQHLLGETDVLTVGYSFSRYSSEFGAFQIKGTPNTSPASTELYFKGNDLSVLWDFKGILQSRSMDINPIGRRVTVRYDYEFNRFVKTDSLGRSVYKASETAGVTLDLAPYNFHRVEVKYDEHVQLPWWRHSLTLSLRGGTIFGPEVPDYFDFYAGGLVGMRGYPFYSLGGNEIATANATYRFPLWENIDVRLLHLYFDKLYASVQYDFGNAWNGRPAVKAFKKDVGFEFRLESYSFYAYPTRIFFNGTYGLDSFSLTRNDVSVQYGKEWRFYFGVLFGFDLD
jgi:Tol biopolymer transport system component